MVSIVPPVIQRAVLPGKTETVNFILTGAIGTLTARLAPEVEGIRLIDIQTQRVTERPFNMELDGPAPPHMKPPYPNVVERELVESVGAGEPVAVDGLEVIGQVDFGTNTPSAWSISTTLVLETTGSSGIIPVPVNLFLGEPKVEVLGQPVAAQIGRATKITARVSLPAGAPAAKLILSSIDGTVTIPAQSVAVAGGLSAEVALNLHLSIAANPGTFNAHLTVGGFGGEEFRVPFAINAVLPPRPPEPVNPQANINAIDRYWREHGAAQGPLGFPLREVERVRDLFLRRFAGGTVQSINGRASLLDRQYVRVQLVGFECLRKSSPIGNDEPYFIVGAAGSNGAVTRLFGPYSVSGDERQMISFDLAGRELALVPPVTLVIIAFEHDSGAPREAEGRAAAIISAIPQKLAEVTDPSSAEIDSHVVAKWLRNLGIGTIFEALAGLFGMGDDPIGRTVQLLHDDVPGLVERRQYPTISLFEGAPYTHYPSIHGHEGNYTLFFKVDLFADPAPPGL